MLFLSKARINILDDDTECVNSKWVNQIVDSVFGNDKLCCFCPRPESTFWTMTQNASTQNLKFPILLFHINKVGARINQMGHHFNKMGARINKMGHHFNKLCHPESTKCVDRFSAPLPMGSGAGLQWSKKRGIFLSSLPQLKIGFGWGSMALNWITAHLRKPHALSNLWVTHSLLS